MSIATLCLALCLLGYSALSLAGTTQERSGFAHPGIVLSAVLLFYALPCPLLVLLLTASWPDVAPNLARHYNETAFVGIGLWYVYTLIGFILAEFVIRLRPARRLAPIQFTPGIGAKLLLSTLTAVLLGLSLLFLNYAKIGGWRAAIAMDRSTAYDALGSSGSFTRYQFAFHVVSALTALAISSGVWRSAAVRWTAVSFLVAYSLFMLLNGTRLEPVVLALAAFAVIYCTRRDWLRANRRQIIVACCIVAPLLFAYGSYRSDVRAAIGGRQSDSASEFDPYAFFPAESTTGYVPGLAMEAVGIERFRRNLGLDFVPATVAEAFGGTKPQPLASEVARRMGGSQAYVTYTVTLPAALAASSGVVAVAPLSMLIYLGSYWLVRLLSHLGALGVAAGAIVFLNSYYIIRVEPANWAGRLWQELALFGLCCLPIFLLRTTMRSTRGRLVDWRSQPGSLSRPLR